MGIYFNSNQSLLTSGSHVVASDPMRSASGYYTPHFSVGASSNPPTGAYITFGQNYNNSRGLFNGSTFTAPTTGLYFFYFHGSLDPSNYNKYVSIRKNNSTSWEQRIYSSSQPDRSFMGGYKLFHMSEGDTCRVYNVNAGLLGANNYTTFSGGLIQ